MNKRPYEVTVVAWILIVVGIVTIASSASALEPPQLFQAGNLGITAVRLLGLVGGIFLLRRQFWAWVLSLAWVAFHTVIGFLNSVGQGVVHLAIFTLIAVALLRSDVRLWFRTRPAATP